MLLLLPQRQEFSSKSQPQISIGILITGCCCYHKGRNFQANHNIYVFKEKDQAVVVATTKVGIFKQITTVALDEIKSCALLLLPQRQEFSSKSQLLEILVAVLERCCCYHKGRNFQANHNPYCQDLQINRVVVATTKVGIFKQITTAKKENIHTVKLLLLPQRQEFSSKSQLKDELAYCYYSCCCYHKGRNFQANHNRPFPSALNLFVVVATTKVGIFKQITTVFFCLFYFRLLLLLPQRQEFSSKSQQFFNFNLDLVCCCCYHKGRNFQANHNPATQRACAIKLLLLPQRQEFSSKSQLKPLQISEATGCCCYHKGRNFQANHNLIFLRKNLKMLLLLPQRQEFSSKSQRVQGV